MQGNEGHGKEREGKEQGKILFYIILLVSQSSVYVRLLDTCVCVWRIESIAQYKCLILQRLQNYSSHNIYLFFDPWQLAMILHNTRDLHMQSHGLTKV